MTLLARIRAYFSPPDPLEPNVELVDSLLAEQAYRADKLRMETALDKAFDRAHANAMQESQSFRDMQARIDAALPPLPSTPYKRKAKLKVIR